MPVIVAVLPARVTTPKTTLMLVPGRVAFGVHVVVEPQPVTVTEERVDGESTKVQAIDGTLAPVAVNAVRLTRMKFDAAVFR
jgi:hypothetical protein